MVNPSNVGNDKQLHLLKKLDCIKEPHEYLIRGNPLKFPETYKTINVLMTHVYN